MNKLWVLQRRGAAVRLRGRGVQAAHAGRRAGAAALYPSTYKVPASAPTLIRNATVLTGTGVRLEHADVLMSEGRITPGGSRPRRPARARW